MEYAEIKELLRMADDAEQKAGNEQRWQAAKEISIKLAEGNSQRKVAQEIGRSQGFVNWYSRVWAQYGDDYTVITFQEAITAVRAAARKPRSEMARVRPIARIMPVRHVRQEA